MKKSFTICAQEKYAASFLLCGAAYLLNFIGKNGGGKSICNITPGEGEFLDSIFKFMPLGFHAFNFFVQLYDRSKFHAKVDELIPLVRHELSDGYELTEINANYGVGLADLQSSLGILLWGMRYFGKDKVSSGIMKITDYCRLTTQANYEYEGEDINSNVKSAVDFIDSKGTLIILGISFLNSLFQGKASMKANYEILATLEEISITPELNDDDSCSDTTSADSTMQQIEIDIHQENHDTVIS